MKDEKIFVTGASGFIGSRFVEVCYLTGNYSVRAGIRNWANCTRIGRFPVEIVQADLLNKSEIKHALEGVKFIVHCGYGSWDVTVNGTKNLLQAAMELGIKRIIHLSTIEVYSNPLGNVTEDFPSTLTGDQYGDSKLEAEKICLQFMQQGLPIVILRLPILYGPFCRNWTVNIAQMLSAGTLGMMKEVGDGKCNLLYIDDLMKAIFLSLEKDSAVAQTFNINGPEIITWNEYFLKFNKYLNLGPIKEHHALSTKMKMISMKPVRMFGGYLRDNHMDLLKKIAHNFHFAETLMRRTEKNLKESVSSAQLKLFSSKAIFNADKAKKYWITLQFMVSTRV